MALNPEGLGLDKQHPAKILDLELKLINLAAKLGNRHYFQQYGKWSKMNVYDFEHPDLQPLKVELIALLLKRPDPPRMIDNSFWTFLGCIGRTLPGDIRRLLYQYYVKGQYPPANRTNLYSRPIHNLINGKSWLHGLTVETFSILRTIHRKLDCIKPYCNAIGFVAYSYSKLAYEAWMEHHMQETHGVSMWTYL